MARLHKAVFVFCVLVAFSSIQKISAKDFEHFGFPPPGKTFIQLKLESYSAPVQITGTIEPPTLLFNGKLLTLESVGNPEFKADKPTLWVNSVPQEVSGGAIGRFFVQLTGDQAAVQSVQVLMCNQEGKYFKASVPLNRTFLDAPLVAINVLKDSEGISSKHVFHIEGAIPENAELELSDAKVIKKSSGLVEIELSLPVGKTVVSGKLIQGGSSRLLNIPANVQVLQHDAKKVILSLIPPYENQLYKGVWEVPEFDSKLEGFTNSDAELSVDAKKATLNSDGSFSASLDPNRMEWDPNFEHDLLIESKLSNGESLAVRKKLKCSSCASAHRWYSPRFRTRGSKFIAIPLAQTMWFVPRNGAVVSNFSSTAIHAKALPASLIFGLGAGYYIFHNFFVDGMIGRVLQPLTGVGERVTLSMSQTHLAQIVANFSPIPVFSIGAGAFLTRARVRASGFSTNVDNVSTTLGALFRLQLRFQFFSFFEVTPAMNLAPAGLSTILTKTSPVRWHYFAIEPFAVRFFL